MGWQFVYGPCWSCGLPFSYNASWVPSIPVRPDGTIGPDGERMPVCRTCMGIANEKRKAQGLAPHPIHPEAYEPEAVS